MEPKLSESCKENTEFKSIIRGNEENDAPSPYPYKSSQKEDEDFNLLEKIKFMQEQYKFEVAKVTYKSSQTLLNSKKEISFIHDLIINNQEADVRYGSKLDQFSKVQEMKMKSLINQPSCDHDFYNSSTDNNFMSRKALSAAGQIYFPKCNIKPSIYSTRPVFCQENFNTEVFRSTANDSSLSSTYNKANEMLVQNQETKICSEKSSNKILKKQQTEILRIDINGVPSIQFLDSAKSEFKSCLLNDDELFYRFNKRGWICVYCNNFNFEGKFKIYYL